MATVKHPTIKGVSYEVDDADVQRWRDAGWNAPGVPHEKSEKDAKTTGKNAGK